MHKSVDDVSTSVSINAALSRRGCILASRCWSHSIRKPNSHRRSCFIRTSEQCVTSQTRMHKSVDDFPTSTSINAALSRRGYILAFRCWSHSIRELNSHGHSCFFRTSGQCVTSQTGMHKSVDYFPTSVSMNAALSRRGYILASRC